VKRSGGIPGEELFRGRRLCVVGNVNRDLRTAPIRAGTHLLEDGETSTDFVRETLGGGGANSALFAATLGARVRFAGKVGDDALGAELRLKLRRRGVRPHLAIDPAHATGTSINLIYDNGRRHFLSCLPSSATLAFEDIDPAALRGAEHVLRADVWFSEPMLFGGNEKLLRCAKAAGADTSLDVNWDPVWGKGKGSRVAERKRAVRKVLPLVDVVHGNVRELCTFADADNLPSALRRVTTWGARAVVVHMGTKGSGYYRDGRLVRSPRVRARREVNATGTGDLLSIVMVLLHRTDMPPADKLKLANEIVAMYVADDPPFRDVQG
jgi:sugar/nucleoside kinase (ribokinase family)